MWLLKLGGTRCFHIPVNYLQMLTDFGNVVAAKVRNGFYDRKKHLGRQDRQVGRQFLIFYKCGCFLKAINAFECEGILLVYRSIVCL